MDSLKIVFGHVFTFQLPSLSHQVFIALIFNNLRQNFIIIVSTSFLNAYFNNNNNNSYCVSSAYCVPSIMLSARYTINYLNGDHT